MKNSVLTFTAAALVSALAIAPAHAHAQDLRVAVTHGDLDIHSATGAEALAGRIEAGVGAACGRATASRDLKEVTLCKQAFLSDAVAQLNSQGATQAAQYLAAKG